MIRVSNDYIIDIDNLNYTVKRDLHRKIVRMNKITGEEREEDQYSTIGYFGDLTGAIKGVINDMNSQALRDGVHTLEEALEIVVKNNRRVSELLERALEI